MNEKSVFELFKNSAEKYSSLIAYRYKEGDEWKELTWAQQYEAVRNMSRSLVALGVGHDEKVNILSTTNLKWIQLDFASVGIGSVTVGIYPSNLAEDCAYIINHSEAVIIFCENEEQLNKVLSVRSKLKTLKHIVLMSGTPRVEGVMSWDEFLATGSKVTDAQLDERANAIKSDDVASIVYTSGTTGVPKGAMITHDNLVFTSWSACESLTTEPGYATLLFLPLAHVFARIIVYVCMRAGVTTSIAESLEKVSDNLKEVRPHFFGSVPRIYEKVYEKITSGVQDAGGVKEKLFNWSVGVGYQVSKLQQAKKPVPAGLAMKHKIATKLVLSKIQAALGGRLVYAISGAAPLNKAIAEFFHACGILILEGLGMTENTSFSHVNRLNNNKFGTVGQPGPEIEHKIASDGELLIRGRNVMKGYFKNKEATDETIDKDGWLYTGDIGEIDEEDFLKITDRKKDLIITAGGKNVAPQRIERIIRTSRYISQIVAIGDQRKFISALITLDQPQLEQWATEHGLKYDSWDALVQSPEVFKLVEQEVQERNKELASYESVKKFTLLPKDFSIESGELTPTLKLKRKVITEHYKDLIEKMYSA